MIQERPGLVVLECSETRIDVLKWLEWRKLQTLVVGGEKPSVLVVRTRSPFGSSLLLGLDRPSIEIQRSQWRFERLSGSGRHVGFRM